MSAAETSPPATTATPLFFSVPVAGSVVILTAARLFAGVSLGSVKPKSAAPKVYSVDRKSTRLNSSHVAISYAVFCLKKKKKNVYVGDEEMFNREIVEALLAWQGENSIWRGQLLTKCLHSVYVVEGAYDVHVASRAVL